MRKKRGVVDVTVHEDDDEEEGGVRGASSRNGGGRRRRGMGSIGSSGIGHGRARQQAASGARDERVGERVPLLAKDDPDETNVSSSFSSFSPHAETRLGVPAASSQRDSLAREEQAARDAELKAIQRKSRRFSESEAEAQLGPLLEEADESSVESQVAHVTTHAHPFDSRPLSTVDDLARQQLVGARPFSGVEEDIDNAHRDLTPDQLIQKLQALPVDFPIGMKRKLQLRRTLLNELRRQGQLEQALPQERRHKQKRALTTAWSSLLPFSRSLYVIESKFGTDVASYYSLDAFTRDVHAFCLHQGGYYLPYAYFVAMFVYFMIQLILLVHELVPRLDADKSLNPLPVSSIFLTWDFKVRTRNDAETHRARFKKNMHAALEKVYSIVATAVLLL
ncbi:hypothetical protein PTSG_01719 [Salpingoeca rosetta]|uniref:Transmembrane protein n=1 Tax=Salpingoeca rosetta (strain ATCC 50818 / BSB-021) TaxID=946362 RepID=F2TYR6_SALR5|nr:uncharacterized protein PTSG_01719 [Salpingoeca rosetta]EGD78740.1 hypothetical protein PTSG_01719 [Salpingoeca rosetta]|eukprot:XP_004997697.1 hypothetical protein PTSG_01719 [Salpingoeca rosetta]